MGNSQRQKQVISLTNFNPIFTADLKSLFNEYRLIVEYLKLKKIFSKPSDILDQIVQQYINMIHNFKSYDIKLCAIDAVYKLHPVDYPLKKVNKQWLIDACLRQNKFIQNCQIIQSTFDKCYQQYWQFLYLVSNSTSIMVPNQFADFMWHSHMLDSENYQKDTIKIFKKVLNHIDDFSEEQLKKFAQDTYQARQKYLKPLIIQQKTQQKQAVNIQTNQVNFVSCGNNCGAANCGGVDCGANCGGANCGGANCGGFNCGGANCGGANCGGGCGGGCGG